MINEILQAENLLKGIGINKDCILGHVYTLAKYFHEQGNDALATRRKILQWAKDNDLLSDVQALNPNSIILKVEKDKRTLRGDVPVYISRSDIEGIKRRFDNSKTRKAALAYLCMGKVVADRDHTLAVSVVAMANWLDIPRSTLYEILQELKEQEYLVRATREKKPVFSWDAAKKTKTGAGRFKLLVPCENNENNYAFILKDNDINTLYLQCFENQN